MRYAIQVLFTWVWLCIGEGISKEVMKNRIDKKQNSEIKNEDVLNSVNGGLYVFGCPLRKKRKERKPK